MDYYGKKLATCSSDKTIRIFESDGRLLDSLKGHEGPVWQIAWSHPKFGSLLASCGYDSKVFIWKQVNNTWSIVKEFAGHTASVNSVAWAPHEYGLMLACASSDGKVSVLTYCDDGTWKTETFGAHAIGVNAVSWCPSTAPGSLLGAQGSLPVTQQKRLVSGGCDHLVKIWVEENGAWKEETQLQGHSDWVRDVAWAPSLGLPCHYIATCSQDKQVLIWSQENGTWAKKPLTKDPFPDVIWRVSWSPSGNVLSVACGDNKVTLWKQSLDGSWMQIGDVQDQ